MEPRITTLTWDDDFFLLKELEERTGLPLGERAAWNITLMPIDDLVYYGYTREEKRYNPWEE